MCNTKFILIQAVNEMKRNAMQDLLRWKADEERKPLVLKFILTSTKRMR